MFYVSFRLQIFKVGLQKLFRTAFNQTLQIDEIRKNINKDTKTEAFSEGEIKSALKKMEEDNQIMVADNVVFLI